MGDDEVTQALGLLWIGSLMGLRQMPTLHCCFFRGLSAAKTNEDMARWQTTPEALARWNKYRQLVDQADHSDATVGHGSLAGDPWLLILSPVSCPFRIDPTCQTLRTPLDQSH